MSRWLLKLPLAPNTWSILIFSLPVCAAFYMSRGTYLGFLVGAAIFQLYSILDGCDGEIARAKFLQTEFGRRLDSICDLIGNVLLALSLGIGLERYAPGPGLVLRDRRDRRCHAYAHQRRDRFSAPVTRRNAPARAAAGMVSCISATTNFSRAPAFSSSARTQRGGSCS